MLYEYVGKKWLERYVENLSQFKDDLDLKIDGYELYLSMDFYDIYNFSFPFSLHSRAKAKTENKHYTRYYYTNQISRSTMFFMLHNIYNKPNILLLPYVIECDNFIDFLDVQVDRYIYESLKKYQENPSSQIKELIKNCKDSGDYDKLINYIADNYPHLIYYYSRGYASSLEMFDNLLTNFLTTNLTILFGDKEENKQDLYYIAENYKAKNIDYNFVDAIVQNVRKSKKRYFQNQRDAQAIYSILCLNEIYNKDKKVFYLFSSADNFKRLMSLRRLNFKDISISGKNLRILREPDFFLDIMFEISNYLNYNLTKASIQEIDLVSLRESIIKTLSKLNYYNSYMFTAGGVFADMIQDDAKKEIGLDITINEMDHNLSLLLDEYINIEGNLAHYKNLDKETAISIINAYDKSEPLTFGLFMRRLEMEKTNLQKKFSEIKKSQKGNLYVVTFSLPFRLNLKDIYISNVINKIITLSSEGRAEFTINTDISQRIFEEIYESIKELIKYQRKIIGDDKLLILQFCFLYIGRYDLVDHIYDLFNNHVEDRLKKEMSYIYLVSFIRKFRAIEISDPNYFLIMAKLCDGYIYASDEKLLKELNSYEIKNYQNKCFLKDKVNGEIFVSKSMTVNVDTIVNSIDIRFFHLKSTILNRFILDFELLEQKQILALLSEYDLTFIPIVNFFEEDYKIAILSSYSYLLSLYRDAPNYKENLEKALSIMTNLYTSVQNDVIKKAPFWGYVRNFQYGFILYKYSFKCSTEEKSNYVQKARNFYELSSRQLPELALNLHKMINAKIALCDQRLKDISKQNVKI
jgi:hypothetical protein